MNSQKLSEPLHNLIMKSEPALADLHRIPDATGAQNNVIWTAEAMIDIGPVFVQNGGIVRFCQARADYTGWGGVAVSGFPSGFVRVAALTLWCMT